MSLTRIFADIPPIDSCTTCSAGNIVNVSRALPGPGCNYCDDGVKKMQTEGQEVSSCSICSGGTTVPNPAKEGQAVGGNECMVCQNGNEVGITANLGVVSIPENTCRYCIAGREEIRLCDEDSDQRGKIVVHDGRTGREVKHEDTIYIDANGVMPDLVAEVDFPADADEPGSIDWGFSSSHPRRDGLSCSTLNKDRDNRSFRTSLSPNAKWRMSNDFNHNLAVNTFGAFEHASPSALKASFSATNSNDFKVQILGKNPSKSDVENHIAAANHNVLTAKIMWSIALHESNSKDCSVVQQFNEPGCRVGANSIFAHTPVFGSPDGWGIMQPDGFDHHCDITTPDIWNWKSNVDKGIGRVPFKRTIVVSGLNSIKRAVDNKSDIDVKLCTKPNQTKPNKTKQTATCFVIK